MYYFLAPLLLFADTQSDPGTAITIALIGSVFTFLGIVITVVGGGIINGRQTRNSNRTDGNTKAIVELAQEVALVKELLRDADRYENESEAHMDDLHAVVSEEPSRTGKLTTRRPARRLRFVEERE